MTSNRLTLLLLVAMLLPAGVAAPRVPSVLFARLRIESDRVLEREPFWVVVVVRGSVHPRRPDTSSVRNFDVAYIGHRSRPSQGETHYRYRFTPRRSGTLEIPPIPVSGGTTSTKTARAVINVEPAPPIEGAALQMTLDPPQAYVGQQVRVRLRFDYTRSVQRAELTLPFARDNRVETILTGLGFVVPLPAGLERIRVNDRNAAATGTTGPHQTELTYEAVIRPLRWGRIRLEPATLRAFTADGKALVHSTAQDLEVRQLPPGAPPDFSGLIGEHDLRVDVQPRRAALGEPLQLTLTLSGQPYLEDARIPDPGQALAGDFRAYRAADSGEVSEAGKVLRYTIRPKRSGAVRMPAISYAYFHPAQGRFVSKQTEPIDLKIDDAPVAASLLPPATASAAPPPAPDVAIEAPWPQPNDPAISWPYFWLLPLVLGSLAAFLLALRRARRAPPPATLEMPPPTALERLRTELAGDPEGEFEAFRRYLARCLDLSSRSLTFHEAAIELRRHGIADSLIDEIGAVFDDADARRFGARTSAQNGPAVLDLTERLDRVLAA